MSVAFQALPKVALAPLMIVWFGFGLEGKVFITAVIAFFPVLANMMAGYHAVEPERIELARSCQASDWHLLTKIILPSSLPFLFAGLSTASVLAILGSDRWRIRGSPRRSRHAADAIQSGAGARAVVRSDLYPRLYRICDELRRELAGNKILLLGTAIFRDRAGLSGSLRSMGDDQEPS